MSRQKKKNRVSLGLVRDVDSGEFRMRQNARNVADIVCMCICFVCVFVCKEEGGLQCCLLPLGLNGKQHNNQNLFIIVVGILQQNDFIIFRLKL